MVKYTENLDNLIDCFQKFPTIGRKSAERLAFSVLENDQEFIDFFCNSLQNVKKNITKCKKCNNYTENELCNICQNVNRNKELLCIVEDAKNIYLFENNNLYNGYYHVLSGLISPLDGIQPSDINFDEIIDHIKEDDVKEVILAVKPSIEGETTSLYLSKLLEKENVIVSRIAQGVPLGADMDYVDSLTLELALENRKKIN